MSVRVRLAAWFVVVMGVLVLATSTITYTIVRSDLHSQLAHTAQRIARTAARGEPGELRLEGLAGPGDRIWLTDSTGRVVKSTAGAPGDSMDAVRAVVRRAPAGYVSARHPRGAGGQVVVLLSNHSVRSTLSTLLGTLLAVGLGILAVAGLMGAFLARRALAPVERMRRQVDDIPGDELDRRITEGRQDEMGRLARAFNRLLERAEYAAEQQQRFVADASHELKTPVTALQGHARIVARSVEREEWGLVAESADVIVRETRRLSATVAELLSLAEAGSQALRAAPVRLDTIAAEACDEMRALAPDRTIEAELQPTAIAGDPGRVGELVRVLVDNALKYSPPDTPVTVTVSEVAGPALAVRDHGPGLSPEDRKRAFDRFYRGSAAGQVAGSGLGLAIAQAICERHRAVLTLEPAAGGGTVATARFPPRDAPMAPQMGADGAARETVAGAPGEG